MQDSITTPVQMKIRRKPVTDLSIVKFPVHVEPLQFVSKSAQQFIDGDCGIAVVRSDTQEIVKAGLSSDYKLVPHSDIIDAVEAVLSANKLNFRVNDCFVGGTRGNKMFLNYILPDYPIIINEDQYTPFIQIHNSYDKSCMFRAVSGLYRLACSNGMLLFKSTVSLLTAKHFGDSIDLSQIAFDLNSWLESFNFTKSLLEDLAQKPLLTLDGSETADFYGEPLKEYVEKIFDKQKDVKAFMESGLVKSYVDELGANQYALMNAFTDYTTHVLADRMNNYDKVAKTYATIERIFLN